MTFKNYCLTAIFYVHNFIPLSQHAKKNYKCKCIIYYLYIYNAINIKQTNVYYIIVIILQQLIGFIHKYCLLSRGNYGEILIHSNGVWQH